MSFCPCMDFLVVAEDATLYVYTYTHILSQSIDIIILLNLSKIYKPYFPLCFLLLLVFNVIS